MGNCLRPGRLASGRTVKGAAGTSTGFVRRAISHPPATTRASPRISQGSHFGNVRDFEGVINGARVSLRNTDFALPLLGVEELLLNVATNAGSFSTVESCIDVSRFSRCNS